MDSGLGFRGHKVSGLGILGLGIGDLEFSFWDFVLCVWDLGSRDLGFRIWDFMPQVLDLEVRDSGCKGLGFTGF